MGLITPVFQGQESGGNGGSTVEGGTNAEIKRLRQALQQMKSERDMVIEQRDMAIVQRDVAIVERDSARDERESIKGERDAAREGWDTAMKERAIEREEREVLRVERDDARAERDAARAERDAGEVSARAERDAAKTERDNMKEAARVERESLKSQLDKAERVAVNARGCLRDYQAFQSLNKATKDILRADVEAIVAKCKSEGFYTGELVQENLITPLVNAIRKARITVDDAWLAWSMDAYWGAAADPGNTLISRLENLRCSYQVGAQAGVAACRTGETWVNVLWFFIHYFDIKDVGR